jgi:hypothetical protein
VSRRGLLGLGSAACAACCTGPLLAAVGSIAALGVAATLIFGATALAVAGGVIAALVASRRRSARRAQPSPQPVALGPTRR